MGLRDFFHLSKNQRRARSKTRSEIGFTERLSEFELVELRPTGSTPDLGTGPLVSPMSGFSNFHGQGLTGTRATISHVIRSNSPFLRNGVHSISDQAQSIFNEERDGRMVYRTVEPYVVEENQSNLDSLAPTAAESRLRRVSESPNIFPPLRAIAGHLCFILENCEV